MTHDELLQLIDRAYEEGWEELDLAGNSEIPESITQLSNLTGVQRVEPTVLRTSHQ